MKNNIFKKLTGTLMAIVLILGHLIPVFAASEAKINGNANVLIESYQVSYSSGVHASMQAAENHKVLMQADFFKPGDWACFEFTIENSGSKNAILSDVLQSDQTSDQISISYGISNSDIGELLRPGEKCSISIVVQLNPEMTDNISSSGNFGLTLIYNAAENVTPKTGDPFKLGLTIGCMCITAAVVVILAKRRYS